MSTIHVDNLSKTFKLKKSGKGFSGVVKAFFSPEWKDVHALQGISFDIEEGERVAFIGPLLEKPVRQLSLGQRMRCEIVASFLHAPSTLFLDIPYKITDIAWYVSFTQMFLFLSPRFFMVINEDIRSGDIAYFLIRPISYLKMRLLEGIGALSANMVSYYSLGVSYLIFKTGLRRYESGNRFGVRG